MKSPEELRREFRESNSKPKNCSPKRGKHNRGSVSLISDIVFFVAIAIVLVSALSFGSDSGSPKTFFGYAYLSVLSSSMQDEIPKGSLVIVKQVDGADIEPGDTITYMKDAKNSVTHKVITVMPNYLGDGYTGFETQGVNNANPDPDIVSEVNVVGVVVFHMPGVGAALMYLCSHIYIVFIMFGLCMIVSFCLRGLFKKSEQSADRSGNVNAALCE